MSYLALLALPTDTADLCDSFCMVDTITKLCMVDTITKCPDHRAPRLRNTALNHRITKQLSNHLNVPGHPFGVLPKGSILRNSGKHYSIHMDSYQDHVLGCWQPAANLQMMWIMGTGVLTMLFQQPDKMWQMNSQIYLPFSKSLYPTEPNPKRWIWGIE